MFTHKQVWAAIDTIADRYGFSASGLAKKAGLDPTSFNPSKRHGPDGRPRWPTTESISRVLEASGASVEEFMDLLSGQSDLVLVAFDTERLEPSLRWELSRGGDLFPHVYGSIATKDALWAKPLPWRDDGHDFPPGIVP